MNPVPGLDVTLSVSMLADHVGALSAAAPQIVRAMQKDLSLYSVALREDGLLPGTLVATGSGWRPIEELQPGDSVATFDNGLQPLAALRRIVLPRAGMPAHKSFAMLAPAGALGNRSDLRLLPCQEVVIESDLAEARHGQAFVMIQALMLDCYNGVRREPIEDDLSILVPTFESEQVIYIGGAALACARAERDFANGPAATGGVRGGYPRLTLDRLRGLAQGLRAEPAAVA